MPSQSTPLNSAHEDEEGMLGDPAEDPAPSRSRRPGRRRAVALAVVGGLAALLLLLSCLAGPSPHAAVGASEQLGLRMEDPESVFDEMQGDELDCSGGRCMGKASQKLDPDEEWGEAAGTPMKLDSSGSDAFRVRLTQGTTTSRWDVKELELYGDAGCSNKLHGSSYVESGHYGDDPDNFWAPKQAFDGDLNSGWGGRGSVNERFIGLQGLDTVRCVRIQQDGATKLAVEKLQPSGTWRVMTEQSVHDRDWTKLQVPDEKDFCSANEHVVNGHCVACPSDTTKPAGDDPFGGNTGCLCLADFHVSDGTCVSCPGHAKNDAGDDTLMGDSVCDIFPACSFDVGATLAMHYPWTWTSSRSLQAQPSTPGDIYVAACRSTLIVSWSSQEVFPWDYGTVWQQDGDSFGYISSFSVGAGAAEMISNYKMPVCSEMGGVTASPDCSVIAALCISRKGPGEDIPGFTTNLVEDSKDDQGRPPFGWDDVWEQQPDPESAKREILNAYLFEWIGGAVSDDPDSSVLVNTAIGGWRYGDWSVALNAEKSLYSITLKTTLYGGGTYHEGAVRFEMSRPDFVRVEGTTNWACGSGHVLGNVQAYNDDKGQSGFWCWTDAPGERYSTYFAKSGEEGDKIHEHDLVKVEGTSGEAIGGPTDIVSRGSEGWLGVLSTVESSSSTKMKVGLAEVPGGEVTWLNLADHDGEGVAWPKLARLGNTSGKSDRFLLGWATFEPSSKWVGPPAPARFHVAEVDHTGAVQGRAYQVDNSGWDVGTEWATVPETGCVAWAFAWSDTQGPRGRYGSWEHGAAFDALYSNKLRVSVYCPPTRSQVYCPPGEGGPTDKETSAGEEGHTGSETAPAPDEGPVQQVASWFQSQGERLKGWFQSQGERLQSWFQSLR